MSEEIKKSYNPFKMWGSWIGLIIFLLILPSGNFSNDLRSKEYAWERYNLCIQCGELKNLDCVIELCKEKSGEISQEDLDFIHMTKQSYIDISCSNHPDIESGHPQAFINGFCGYDMWRGFNYGEKPNKILTYFSLHNYKQSFDGLAMGFSIFSFLIPIVFFLIGWGIHSLIRKLKS